MIRRICRCNSRKQTFVLSYDVLTSVASIIFFGRKSHLGAIAPTRSILGIISSRTMPGQSHKGSGQTGAIAALFGVVVYQFDKGVAHLFQIDGLGWLLQGSHDTDTRTSHNGGGSQQWYQMLYIYKYVEKGGGVSASVLIRQK